MRFMAAGIVLSVAVGVGQAGELAVEDFQFDGPLGSQGAKIEKVGPNDFKITLGAGPNQPGWPNHLQFQILRHAKGNGLHITARSVGGTGYGFTENFSSWSYDGNDWRPIDWTKLTKTVGEGNVAIRSAELTFPPFEQDTAWFGWQVPMTYEQQVAMIESWKKDPAVTVHLVGQSLGKRNLYRVEITDPNSPYPRPQRWVHYVANQHPGEFNSMWRIVGMVNWLLSDEGADARKRFICHFNVMMSPDGVAAGWHRTNAEGIDMNRSYSRNGADPRQGHEPYLWQKDLESIMASDSPATTIWSMHTWPGAADPSMTPGPETDNLIGPATQLADILTRLDPNHELVKPLKIRSRMKPRSKAWAPTQPGGPELEFRGGGEWNSGPGAQFGVTNVLCEGGADLYTKKQNLDCGGVIMKALAEYYRGTKAAPGTVPASRPAARD
jgi:hypothetical protein